MHPRGGWRSIVYISSIIEMWCLRAGRDHCLCLPHSAWPCVYLAGLNDCIKLNSQTNTAKPIQPKVCLHIFWGGQPGKKTELINLVNRNNPVMMQVPEQHSKTGTALKLKATKANPFSRIYSFVECRAEEEEEEWLCEKWRTLDGEVLISLPSSSGETFGCTYFWYTKVSPGNLLERFCASHSFCCVYQ